MAMGCMWKNHLKGRKKPWVSKDQYPLLCQAFVLCKNGGFPYTMVMFSLKEGHFLYLTSLQTFYHFLYCSFLVLTLIVQQHVPLIVQGMLLGTGQMSYYDSPIWNLIQLLYYVVAGGERKGTPRSVYWCERWPCHYMGSKPWTRKGTSGGLRAMHVSPIVI